MHKDVTRPSDIAALKHDLIVAVTNAYMAKRVTDRFGLEFEEGSCDKGEFRYRYRQPGWDAKYYVSYPGGQWRVDVTWGRDGDVDPHEHENYEVFDANEVYSFVEEQVSAWIDPWSRDCQSPNVFTNQINSVANIAGQLYIGNDVTFGGKQVTPEKGDRRRGSAVTDVRSAIDEIKISVDDMDGTVIDAFQRTYVMDIERTLGGQRGLATAAGLAITLEAVAWNEAFYALQQFLLKAIHDFNDLAGAHGSSGKDRLAVLGAVAAVSGMAAGTVGVAFPPFGVAMAAVSGVATIASLMLPATEAVAAEPLALHGESYMDYWESFKDGLKAINTDLADAEIAIAQGCRRMIQDFRNHPDNYSLERTTKKGDQGPHDDNTPFLNSRINFSPGKMRMIAGAVESIGDHQRALANRLGGVDGAGNPSAFVQNEWTRGSLPEVGVMGSGHTGPFTAYANVVELLTDLLIGESKAAGRIADHCMAVASDFTKTDEERERALNALARTFDTEPIPVVNRSR